jgi:type I restriction enzyme S subunit
MVKQGFKQTEIGEIPVDWDVMKLGDIGKFSKGKGISKDESLSGVIPAIRYGEIYTKHHNVIVKFYSFISREVAINSKPLKYGDLLFAGSGETKEDIGKTIAFVDKIEGYVGGDIVILSPKKNLNSIFLGYLMNSRAIQIQKSANGQGDAVVHIYQSGLSDIQIPLPPLPEQKAIAEALSNTDTWIESLEKLIAKKRLIKQGAMQQLLTPKADWEVKKLVEVIDKCTTGKLDANAMVENGEFRFYTCAKNFSLINNYAFDDEALLISGNGANVGYIHYYNGKFNAYQRTYVLTGFKINAFFLKVLLDKNLKERIDKEVSAGNTPYIKMDTITNMDISFPKSLTEQTLIATILSDMDTELESLAQQLAKAKQIKQGMMQELLTGRVRLV